MDGEGPADEPKNKIAKLSDNSGKKIYWNFNQLYRTDEFIHKFSKYWNYEQIEYVKDEELGVEVISQPYKICILPSLLQNVTFCKKLVEEITSNVKWSRKHMDLYEFYQSSDLSNMTDCKLLTEFLKMLRQDVCPWLKKITNLQLDYVSASCSMYTSGDYLLVHDDLLKDRQIAFIYYLTPWENLESWNQDQGGCLEIFDCDNNSLPQYPIRRAIFPKNNQFAFFKVGTQSFHQVREVTTYDYPRLTINGWFHGASNEQSSNDSEKYFHELNFRAPFEACGNILELYVNQIYLSSFTKGKIQKRMEDNSEICLYDFLKTDFYEKIRTQLLNDTQLQWIRKGPANARNYEVLDSKTSTEYIEQLLSMFNSSTMFTLLKDYTELDLSGPNQNFPQCLVELQRWSHGSYTVLEDGCISADKTLDLIFYINASEAIGVITYLSPDIESNEEEMNVLNKNDSNQKYQEDDSVLLTITPEDNTLNIVYRCEGTTKFVKYVSRNITTAKGYVYILSCSYKE